MTSEKSFKRRVRERMTKTGESYAAARTQVVRKRDRVRAAQSRLVVPDERPSDERVEAATGRRWDAWFAILDRWGGRGRTHKQTAAFLMGEHAVPGWWAQTITVWYQRDRGLRLKHQQADGFSVYASKTIAAPVTAVFEAFVHPRRREQWLGDADLSLRTSQPDRTARFDWGDGSTRVNVFFEAKGEAKTTVSVAHERLPDADEAETAKAAWRSRLADLKSFLAA
ncbi:MAG TPA: hypothetical protein VKZ74_06050 [Natronosporangium sp.]|nr:hypothetical protein [Natronosporangium sp.]